MSNLKNNSDIVKLTKAGKFGIFGKLSKYTGLSNLFLKIPGQLFKNIFKEEESKYIPFQLIMMDDFSSHQFNNKPDLLKYINENLTEEEKDKLDQAKGIFILEDCLPVVFMTNNEMETSVSRNK